MAFSSVPMIFPNKIVNGTVTRLDLPSATPAECNYVMGIIFDIPVSWEVAGAFTSADGCVPTLLVLREDS